MAFINNTVGYGGRNNAQDVKIIQWMLRNAQFYYGEKIFSRPYGITENGIVDNEVVNAIQDVINFPKTLSSYRFSTSQISILKNISPNDENYRFLIRCSIKPLCVPCVEGKTIYFDNNPVVQQAIDGTINFITFRHIAEAIETEKICRTLTAKGVEAEKYLKNPKIRAFLDMIAEAEGWFYGANNHRPPQYDEISGWLKVDDISSHPNKKGSWSTAAGRYQFMPPDWAATKKATGVLDFTPRSQDIAAVYLLMTRNNIIGAILEDNIFEAIQRASGTWASLPDKNKSENADVNNFPTSHYNGQKAAPANALRDVYDKAYISYKNQKNLR